MKNTACGTIMIVIKVTDGSHGRKSRTEKNLQEKKLLGKYDFGKNVFFQVDRCPIIELM